MAAKSLFVVSSLLALAFAAPQAFAGNAPPNLAEAPTQQISPPTDGSSTPRAQSGQHQHRHKHAHKKRRQQQPGGTPQQGWGSNPG
jgi:hypothetical protein